MRVLPLLSWVHLGRMKWILLTAAALVLGLLSLFSVYTVMLSKYLIKWLWETTASSAIEAIDVCGASCHTGTSGLKRLYFPILLPKFFFKTSADLISSSSKTLDLARRASRYPGLIDRNPDCGSYSSIDRIVVRGWKFERLRSGTRSYTIKSCCKYESSMILSKLQTK